jgi:threonine/homoserine/homoserine lactone efflux protein
LRSHGWWIDRLWIDYEMISQVFAVFTFSFVLAIGAVASPGPVSTAIVSQAPRRGWRVGPLVATGHSLMEFLIVVLVTFGLGVGLARPGIQTGIAFLGGLLLLWMGGWMLWQIWQGKVHLPRAEEQSKSLSNRQFVGIGIFATLSNPFWYAWWVTVGAGYLSGYLSKVEGITLVVAFYLGHITADYAWDTLLSTVVGGGRRWMTDTVYRGLLLACGIFFIYLGGMFLVQGIKAL